MSAPTVLSMVHGWAFRGMATSATQESYDEQRQRVIAAGLPLAAVVISGTILFCGLAELTFNGSVYRFAAAPYALFLFVPWFAVWLVKGSLARSAEGVALGADVFYTAMLAVLLLQPTTTLSSGALFFALKMVATALFFPWRARTQYLSAGLTLVVYWGVVVATGRGIDPDSGLHQIFGPLIAAVFSVAGARSAELRRRDLFQRGVDLEVSASRLEWLLAAVRDSEMRLRRQQAEQQEIFDSVPAMIWYKDCDNRIVRANRPAATAAGLTPDAMEGRSVYELYPDEAAKYHGDDLEVIESGQAKRGIIEMLQASSGEKRWVRTDKVPYQDESGKIVGVVVFAVDITERQLAEEALELSARQLEHEVEVTTALAHVGQVLISALNTPVILDRLCKLTMDTLQCDFSCVVRLPVEGKHPELVSGAGFTPEEWEALQVMRLPRSPFIAFVHQLELSDTVRVDTEVLPPSVAKVLANKYGVALTLSAALRRSDEIFGILTAGYRDKDKRFTSQQERILRGLAQLASLALENARLVEALERADGIKSEFVATMSHELRTPLNVITGYSSLLLDGEFGELTEDQAVTLQRVEKSAAELLELINATLDLSRLQGGHVALDVQPVTVAQLLAQVKSEIASCAQPGVRLDWRLAPDLARLQTDPLKLKVVLKNIVSNACKFTAEGSVTVHARNLDGGVEIAVTDTGIGIAPEVLPVIFEAFRQADGSTTRRYGGVGLGLYIVQRLLDLLHGNVSVDSVVGGGSTFRVWVPHTIQQKSAA